MKKIILPCLLVFALFSCVKKAEIAVQNKVHNATLTKVSWDGHSIASSLMPGETGRTYKVTQDEKNKFPRNSVVKFYMTRGGNQVYLETKYSFLLDVDDNLLIVISDTTQVINPAVQ
jgi:hypothetical protein